MGYVPKFIHLDHFISVEYPFGVHWKHSYIQQSAEAIFNTYKEDIEEGILGTFYISTGLYKSRKATVYVAAKSDYKASYFYMRIAKIKEIGIGVRFWVSKSQDGKYLIDPYYITYSEYKWSNRELPDYVFLTKEEKISD
nr:MAG TPA: hypothetical protein [Crassvirales sp.]